MPGWPGAVARGQGEGAVAIEFGDRVDPEAQRRVAALTAVVDRAAPGGLIEVVPTFRSALLVFDPMKTDQGTLLDALPPEGSEASGADATRGWRVPVSMDDAVAEDLPELADALGMSPEAVRERLLAAEMRVGMYGFVPGAAYLTGLPDELYVPRRPSPRTPVPVGSVIVAVGQVVILPVSMPTGWYVVGRTSARMFDPGAADRGEPPVPFAVGDRLRWEAVDADRLDALREEPRGGVRPDG